MYKNCTWILLFPYLEAHHMLFVFKLVTYSLNTFIIEMYEVVFNQGGSTQFPLSMGLLIFINSS